MKYFNFYELEKSATAARLGINNEGDQVVRANLRALVEHVLDPLREAWGEPIIVTSGYRCPRLNAVVGGAVSSQHCFDTQTEVLTLGGWKTYNEVSIDDEVFSYNLQSDEIEVVPIDDIIIREHHGRMLSIQTTCLDIFVTDKHRMVVRYPTHKYRRKSTYNISPSGQAYFDSLKSENYKYHIELAEELVGKRRIFKCAGHFNGLSVANIDLLKFAMAFVSDGYWCKKNACLGMGFRFKKMRKVRHLIELANNLGWAYALHKDKFGVYNFYFRHAYATQIFDVVGHKKELPLWLITLNDKDALELAHCYAAYDGCVDKRDDNNRVSISTISKRNADVLQAMFTLSNVKCQVKWYDRTEYTIKGQRGVAKPFYSLLTCPKTETRANEDCYRWEQYDGIVWCVNNRNTTLVTRRNGKIAIVGNCKGEAADIRTVSDSRESNMRLLRKLLSLGLPFDQLICEYPDKEGRPDWIHVSYKRGGKQRGQQLTARRLANGKTAYSYGIKV